MVNFSPISITTIILVCIVIAGIVLAIIFGLKKDKEEESKVSPFWVAVGDSTYGTAAGFENIVYSTDGQCWKPSSSSGMKIKEAYGVAYGTTDNKNTPLWVAVGNDPSSTWNNILFSRDGQCWQPSNDTGLSFTVWGSAVGYGLSSDGSTPLWVAVGTDGGGKGKILWSTDGQKWNASTGFGLVGGEMLGGVAYGTSSDGSTPLWVIAGDNPSPEYRNMLWSTDGQYWQYSDSSSGFFNYHGSGVAYGKDSNRDPLWVAVGKDTRDNNNNILWSNDGQCWNYSDGSGASFGEFGKGVAYGTTDDKNTPLWVAVGEDNVGGYNSNILFSTNGKFWEISRGASFGGTANADGNGVAYGTDKNGNPLWVAVGDNEFSGNDNILYSLNGMDWFYSEGDDSGWRARVAFNKILPTTNWI